MIEKSENLPANPQEELSRLREAAVEREKQAKESGAEITPYQAAREITERYSEKKPAETIHPQYAIKEREAETIALGLSPEPHDRQIEGFVGILQEKGIKNALTVVRKLDNPHLLDDFHRFLARLIASGHNIPDLAENSELWKPLHMTLFEISLPEMADEEKNKQLKELVSGMEQFYAGMLSISGNEKNPEWFAVEAAKAIASNEFVFYVSVPTAKKDLFEKQVIAIFPSAKIKEQKNDYNIFNASGASAVSRAKLAKNFLYPLRPYDTFDVDPIGVILNSFSKLDRDNEGVAVQFVIGQRQDALVKEAEKSIRKMREGEKIETALQEIGQSFGGVVIKEVFGILKSEKQKEKEKEEKAKNAQTVDQTILEQFVRKIKSPLISIDIRIAASAADEPRARAILRDIESGFNQFENGRGNRIEWEQAKNRDLKNALEQFTFRTFNSAEQIILNLEELTTCFHFPTAHSGKAAPQLKQAKAGIAPVPLDIPKEGTLIGINKYRGETAEVFITSEDRMRHFYAIGQTGTGKTSLLKNMIIQDMKNGHGACFIDPHGSDVADILANVPPERYEDVIYFDPASIDRPMALNMLEYDRRFPEQKIFVINEMFSIFQKLYGAVPESMGPMFEQYFRNATGLVIEDPESGSTLLDVSRVMSNKAFRDLKLSRCKNPIIVQFWKEIAEKAGGEAALANMVPYITSKFDIFLANEIMRPIIAQEKSSFNMREIMDNRKILLVNLSKGRLGDINSHLLGLILVGKILMAALSRVDSFGKQMNDFYLYLDEFQNITTDSIAVILSEARKYRLSLTLAHQFIGQLDEKIKNAVFGNVGSLAVFRTGVEDAEFLEKQFAPIFTKSDIINLDNFNAYIRLLVNGRPAKPFSVEMALPEKGNIEQIDKLKEISFLAYGRPRAEIEEEIMEKYAAM